MSRLLTVGFLCLAMGCVGDTTPTMNPLQGYDSLGEVITPHDAIPVQVVAAEGTALIGKPVKLEGRISEVCRGNGCWLTLQVINGPIVRVDVPREEDGGYVYTFPKDASGRRAILSGVLERADPESELDEPPYTLVATGALLERVRA